MQVMEIHVNMNIFLSLYDQRAFLRLIIPMTWANVTHDTGRLFNSRLSDMRRAAIRCAGAPPRRSDVVA